MTLAKRNEATTLNDHDRIVLDKYTKYFTNFIESSTAKKPSLSEDRYNPAR